MFYCYVETLADLRNEYSQYIEEISHTFNQTWQSINLRLVEEDKQRTSDMQQLHNEMDNIIHNFTSKGKGPVCRLM